MNKALGFTREDTREKWIPVKMINGEPYVGKVINGVLVFKKEKQFQTKWFRGGRK